jgi:hypothetical protein
LKIAGSVFVGIHEGTDGKAINNGVLVPEITDHSGFTGLWRARR